ncbi:MAG: ketol-acid reductoisomerase [Opitutales bacterium]|nr:ketol-acid reductoisomerase [Opitutales bacterium]
MATKKTVKKETVKAAAKKAVPATKTATVAKAAASKKPAKKAPAKAVKIFHDKDADLSFLKDKTIAIMGFGAQGRAQALCLRDSGCNVIIGVRKGKSFKAAKEAGFAVFSVAEAAKRADIIHILLPDESHKSVYADEIAKYVTPGKTLCCSHGFAYVFKNIVPPAGVDVIMVAPKGPGTEVRRVFEEGFGCPGLVAVWQDASGKALATALAIAKGEGLTRGGVLECTMQQETYEDLFGEQNVLCGGIVDLMKYGFETLIEAGYPGEMAYFECIHEAKLIVDIIYNKGIAAMNGVISNTAEFGEYFNGPKIITPDVKKRMKESLKRIESGEFAKIWMREASKGAPVLAKKREQLAQHPAEIVGAKIRKLFERK